MDDMVHGLLEKGTQMLSLELLKSQLDEEIDPDAMEDCPVCQTLIKNLMSGGNGQYRLALELNRPVIGIGAPIQYFLPKAVLPLGAKAVLPKDADVANAICAVTSMVMVKRQLKIIPGSGDLEQAGHHCIPAVEFCLVHHGVGIFNEPGDICIGQKFCHPETGGYIDGDSVIGDL